MGLKVLGSMVLGFVLGVLFPVEVQLCVTYKLQKTCGLTGSSVEFPCSYPKHMQVIDVLGWYKITSLESKALNMLPAYSNRMNFLGNGTSDCTMNLTDLRRTDSSTYSFMYIFRKASGARLTCKGYPGVRLHIFESPVRMQADEIVGANKVPVKNKTVAEGQRIMLTCVPTCTEKPNNNTAYIWYKDRGQLNGSKANNLSFHSIGEKDMGIYACAVTGYNDLPSSPFNLKVRRGPRNTVVSGGGSNKDGVPPLTHCHNAQCSIQENFNNCQTPRSMFSLCVMLIPCFCMGLLIAIMVSIQLLIAKKKAEKKIENRGCAVSFHGPQHCNSDSYVNLDIDTLSPVYETIDTVLAAETVYDNIVPAMR
ncbi:hypothetical protein EXN66_Car020282 [Channa argus]|uniref:Ig-like domain-containing protein n=1 Tax=Channa argus TaxID=215402 RepID=A0A6G1QQM0_CHAAH|nr:hypothetical protein EXN66_Car020282 [Channa argus]KAK2884959.1 hypothetical protein Q8A73_021433 [Channa argus]